MTASDADGAGTLMVLAASPAPDGTAGTYKATSLSPAGSWAHGGSTGAFTYAYPVTVPPAVGGPTPAITLAYSSSGVDGRTSATNNQASWIGDGWEYSPGFIERTYRACADDGEASTNGELCWAGDNATLSLNGRSSELVPAGGNQWRLADDDGSVVEKLSGAPNGVNAGTYWKVTAQDGTQYFFGAYRLPASVGGDGTDGSTYSAWGVPVYGNDTGEPCHGATLDASRCTQGWRWNLDFVVDPHGNLIKYKYGKERNYYAAGSTRTLTQYVRGGYPTTIYYGWRTADYVAKTVTNAPATVTFTVAERCDGSDGFDCSTPISSSNASHWPDVPYDQNCESSGSCGNYAPSFWTRKRLTTVTTKVWDTSLATPGYRTVDTYTLANQSFPDPGDGTDPTVWLTGITRAGNDTGGGPTAPALPQLKFAGTPLPNRVEGLVLQDGASAPTLNRMRMQNITTETGARIGVGYDTPACSRASLPAEDDNPTTCYPVRWIPPNYTDPILDWFSTYTVDTVEVTDPLATASPSLTTTYQYAGTPAWHHTDNEATAAKYRSWGQFRGYSQVITRTGSAPDPITQTRSYYLQGMHGDLNRDGSTKSVSVTNLLGESISDDQALAGYAYQMVTDSASGGAARAQTLSTPWLSPPTAVHDRAGNLPDQVARFTDTARSRDRVLLADGTWRTTETASTFDPATGLVTSVDDKGEVDPAGTPIAGSTTPRSCTMTTYATDSVRNMMAFPAEVTTVAGDCATPADAAHTLARTRSYYGSSTLGQIAAGNGGDITAVTNVKGFSGGTAQWTAPTAGVYDAYGRVTSQADPLGRTTTTAYLPAGSKPGSTDGLGVAGLRW